MQGIFGISYKGTKLDLKSNHYHSNSEYYESEELPLIFPLSNNRENKNYDIGDIILKEIIRDKRYLGFFIYFRSGSTYDSNNLGKVFSLDLQILKTLKKNLKVFDCRVNIQ